MGHKWMILSGRGASLMDAIQSPVNTAGSIYLNHNVVHYEPILRVDKAKCYKFSISSYGSQLRWWEPSSKMIYKYYYESRAYVIFT